MTLRVTLYVTLCVTLYVTLCVTLYVTCVTLYVTLCNIICNIICNMQGQIIHLLSDESENLERRRRLGDLSIDGRTEHYHALLIATAALSTRRFKVTCRSPVLPVRAATLNTMPCVHKLSLRVTYFCYNSHYFPKQHQIIGLRQADTIFTL